MGNAMEMPLDRRRDFGSAGADPVAGPINWANQLGLAVDPYLPQSAALVQWR
ncbi:MAG: hypothetical protein ACKN81_13325 [Pirellulaceae bacterium]